MRKTLALSAVLATFAVGAAMAQPINLSGRYVCVNCPPGQGHYGFITQSGRDLNIVNDHGQSSRGYVDWPGRIWTFDWNEAAVVSPDGLTIQFDKGSVWKRVVH